jgi:zinc protease
MARRLTASPLPAWVGDLPVFERTLPNGLKALVLPRGQAPVVVCDLYYPVGSADEPPGRSGLAHFLEHMLFKGTDWLPKGQIDRLAFLAAGMSNAETSEDCTHYWFAFPRDRWELALAVEADRMRNAVFDPAEVEAERHVIAEERARELDSPLGRLDQTHLTLSYLVHPYRNPILGWPEDVRRLTVDDLSAFYRAHYRPDGAVVVVVGAVEPQAALDRIAEHFGPLPAGSAPRPGPPPAEPRQSGRRGFTLVEPDGVVRGLLGWHTVPRHHPDAPALEVLADLLTCGRRSRLWSLLVERQRRATWVDASHEAARLAGQFLVQIEAGPGTDPQRLEAAIAGAIAELAEKGPHAEELERSRHRLEAAWRWEQEDLAGLALGLGSGALWGDWRAWQNEHRAALAVTPDDIQRIASTYLREDNLTAGWSLPGHGSAVLLPPDGAGGGQARNGAPPVLEHPLALAVPGGASRLADYQPRRSTLPNGLRIVSERRSGTGTVALDLYAEAGQLVEARPGVAHLTGRLREEGTASLSAEELAAAIEDVGGTLDVGATGVSLRVRAEDLELAVWLAAEVILRPTFPGEAVPWLKRRIAAELAGDLDDPSFRAELVFRGLIYGEHPYGRDPRGNARQIAALTRDDAVAHHARTFTPDNALVIAAGDFDTRRLRSLVAKHFGGWRSRRPARLSRPRPPRLGTARTRRIEYPGEQVHILLGHLGIRRSDPDHDALVVLDHILGSGPGFTDRLSRLLRDELGLAYSVGGGIAESADLEPGLFRVYVGTSPDQADRAVAAVMEQIRAMHEGAFEDVEVERAKGYLIGSWVFDFQTVAQRADRLLELERWGLPLDEPRKWPERIARITPAQVRAAARRHLHPEAIVRVEYGPTRGRRR